MKLPPCLIVAVVSAFCLAPTTAWALAPGNGALSRASSSSKLRPMSTANARLRMTMGFDFRHQPRHSTSSFTKAFVSDVASFGSVVKREIRLTYGMLKSDLPTTVCLGTTCSIAFGVARAAADHWSSETSWTRLVSRALLWFLGYLYFFDIGNQMTGVEEDRSNADLAFKAQRPLATGEMTMQGAKIRHVLSGFYYVGISWWLGGIQLSACAVAWIISCQLHNFRGWGDHFVTKNYFTMSSGSVCMLVGARLLAGELRASIVPPILAALWIGLCMDVQDFRDEAGDRASGRLTTPVLWGVKTARQLWVGNVVLASAVLGYILRSCLAWPDAVILFGAIALVVRTLKNTTAKEDHTSYNGICAVGAMFFFRSPFWAHLF